MSAKVFITLPLVSALLLAAALLFGCGGGTAKPAGPAFEAVAPILSQHCIACHQDRGIAPFSLTSYTDAKAKAAKGCKPAVTSREIPFERRQLGQLRQFRQRPLADRRGDRDAVGLGRRRRAARHRPRHAGGSRAGAPGRRRRGRNAGHRRRLLPSTARADDYRCFVVDPGLPADKLLVAYEVVPGEPRVVHHAVLYMLAHRRGRRGRRRARRREAGLGYTCFGGARVDGTATVAAWAPGSRSRAIPGTGVRVPGGRKAVLQIHYNLAGGALAGSHAVRLHLVDAVPHEALIAPLVNVELSLPPGQRLVTSAATGEIPDGPGLDMLGVYPHMHLRGRTLGSNACAMIKRPAC